MNKNWGLKALLVSCGIAATQFACSSGADEGTAVATGDRKIDDLIGSVPVESKSLDGIGSIGLVYDYGSGGGGNAGFGGFFAVDTRAGGPGAGGVATGGSFPTAGTGGGGQPFSPQCTGTLISKSSVLTS